MLALPPSLLRTNVCGVCVVCVCECVCVSVCVSFLVLGSPSCVLHTDVCERESRFGCV